MAKQDKIPEQVIMAATGMLQAYYPELSPVNLVKALEATPKPAVKRRVSPREYANMMGISIDTAKRLCRRGEIEWERVGRQIRILV